MQQQRKIKAMLAQEATSENTFIQGLEIEVHRDS